MKEVYPETVSRALADAAQEADEEIDRILVLRQMRTSKKHVPRSIVRYCRRALGNDADEDAWDGGVMDELSFGTTADHSSHASSLDGDDGNESYWIISLHGGGD